MFRESLAIGKVGESQIAKGFLGKGYCVLPVYEKEVQEFKGPVLFMPEGQQAIAPDMLVMKNEKVMWIEAKHKSASSWHRKTGRWVTGIDIRHYLDYLEIQKLISLPIWLMFLHKEGIAKDTPLNMKSSSGLFGNSLKFLMENENHRHDNWGRSGMVYWAIDKLRFIADI